MTKRKHTGRKKLDVRAKKVAAGLLAGKSDVAACIDAGYTPISAKSNAYEIVRRPSVQSELTEALEACGITPRKAAQVIAEGLDAKMIVYSPDAGAGIMVNLPAHAIRLKAYDRWVQAYGYVPRQIEMPAPAGKGLTVIIEEANVQVNQYGTAPQSARPPEGNGQDRSRRVVLEPANGEAR